MAAQYKSSVDAKKADYAMPLLSAEAKLIHNIPTGRDNQTIPCHPITIAHYDTSDVIDFSSQIHKAFFLLAFNDNGCSRLKHCGFDAQSA